MLILPASTGSVASRVLSPPATRPGLLLSVSAPIHPGQQGQLFPLPSAAAPPAPITAPQQPSLAEVAQLVYLSSKGTAITSSRTVAQYFQKEHKHVLRDIRAVQADLLDIDDDEVLPCFADNSYRDSNNQSRPEILMTQRGFMLLAMGFTGREAMRFKVAFLDAFERLQAHVTTPAQVVPKAAPITCLAQLPYYARKEMQIEVVKQTATYVLERTGGNKNLLVRHQRTIMKTLTGLTPSQYRQAKLDAGVKRITSLSGRELLRRFEPAKAAVAAVFDDCVRLGIAVETLGERNVAHTLEPAFESILALGLEMADLHTAA